MYTMYTKKKSRGQRRDGTTHKERTSTCRDMAVLTDLQAPTFYSHKGILGRGRLRAGEREVELATTTSLGHLPGQILSVKY